MIKSVRILLVPLAFAGLPEETALYHRKREEGSQQKKMALN